MPEYRFDRYRNGRKMAEDLVLTKPATVEQAMEAAYLLAGPGDMFVLREDRARLAAVEAERDAARAGEARAVEALSLIRKELGTIAQGYEEEVRNEFTSGQSHGWGMAYLHAVQIIGGITDGPSLDWLAQQRREAAAEENDRWADEWWELARPSSLTASDFTARAAALRAGEVGND